MKILIIGSEGYIGGRLMPYLRSKGHYVHCVDRMFYGDYVGRDYDTFDEEIFSRYEVIILLAGHSSPALCGNDPKGSFHNNVTNFANLLGKLKKGQRLLYASSASVCNGLCDATEDTPLNAPISDYDMQKQVIEKIASLSEVTTVGMRFGTIGGYSPNPRLDSIINSVYHDGVNKKKVTITNGGNMRSYLGMNDMCKAVEALINVRIPNRIYNIASGTHSILAIANGICAITDAEIVNGGGDNKYSFWMNTDKINSIVPMTDTIESICNDMGDMPTKDKTIFNRNTNLFKY